MPTLQLIMLTYLSMIETSQQIDLLAISVVSISLTILGFFLWKTLVFSNLFNRGTTLYQQKDYEGAEAVFRQVAERQHSNDMVRLLLGNALMQQDKLDEAISVFQELIERSPKNIDAYLGLGKVLLKQGKLEDAITVVQKARNSAKALSVEEKKLDQLIQEMTDIKSNLEVSGDN